MKTENKNKLILFIASLVTLISIFSSLNIQLASANWDSGTSGPPTGALTGGNEATWLKVTGNVNRNSLFYRAYRRRDDKRTLSSLFDEAKNNKIDSFLKAQDRYIFYINDRVLPGVLPRATWDNSPLPKLPDKTDAESRAIFNEVKRTNPGFQYKPFVVFGNFSKPKSSCATGVCVCDVGTGPKYQSHKKFEQDKLNVSGDYSYQITITPVKPIGFENLSKEEQVEWLSTHKTQMTNPELTAFGKFVKEYNYSNFSGQVDSQKLWDDFKKQAEQKSKESINSPNINLSEDNLKGFQRGGAFTITTNVKKVTISTSVTTDYRDVYNCVKGNDGKYYYKKTGEERVGTLVSEPNSGGVSKSINFDAIGGYTPKYSYQIVNVRCNRNYFSDLVKYTKSTITSGSKNLSSSAQSPLVENGIATFYNNLDTRFFYDGKDCIFKCSASPTGQSAGPNDASNNIQNRGNNKIKYGAQTIEGDSNDSFTFFRDNIFKVVRVDVWHPIVDNNEMSYNADTPAYKTKFILRKDGTPRAELFSVTDESGNVILKDFPTNSTLTLNGQRNKFGYQGGYASEKDKEHRTNLRFTYSVNTKISVPTLNVYGVVSSTDYDTEALDVTCYTTFNTTVPQSSSVAHGPKANNYKDNSDFNNEDNKTLKVGFVKASAE
jgi:hypothetical protein